MRFAFALALCAALVGTLAPDRAFARKKIAPEQIDAWAACAVEQNANERVKPRLKAAPPAQAGGEG